MMAPAEAQQLVGFLFVLEAFFLVLTAQQTKQVRLLILNYTGG